MIDEGSISTVPAWHAGVFIALGSNLGDRANNLRLACSSLASCAGIVILRRSSIYRSSAMYDLGQPYFLNMVCECTTQLEPRALLSVLQRIERTLGRVSKEERFSARPIDLDIVYYGDLLLSSRDLQIPHPRLSERPFVLNPLAEIAASFHDPQRKRSVASLQEDLKCQQDEAIMVASTS